MKIKNIKWICIDSAEADVVITDGEYDIICFSHPCNYSVGMIVNEELSTLNAKNVMRHDRKEYIVNQSLNGNSNYFVGQLINKSDKIVSIGDFQIEIDSYIPNDINDGEYIQFSCSRVDLY